MIHYTGQWHRCRGAAAPLLLNFSLLENFLGKYTQIWDCKSPILWESIGEKSFEHPLAARQKFAAVCWKIATFCPQLVYTMPLIEGTMLRKRRVNRKKTNIDGRRLDRPTVVKVIRNKTFFFKIREGPLVVEGPRQCLF